MKKACMLFVLLAAVVAGAFAQGGNWQVLESWGQLPAGLAWGGASQVSTTPDG